MNRYPLLERHLARLQADVAAAARGFLECQDNAHLDTLLDAARARDIAAAALVEVAKVDDRIYDSAGRYTGSHRPKSYLTPGALPGAAAEPGAYDPPRLLSRREREV